MFIDTHCHLTFPDFDGDRMMVLGNAKKAGVKKIINPSVDPASSRAAVDLARKHPGEVFAAVGIHPYEAQRLQNADSLIPLLTSVVAIGECGLDYHQYKGEAAEGKKQKQRILFEEQLRLALAHDLPVIMHCRDAYEDFFSVLDGLPSMPKGVVHCFSGGLQELRMAIERNLYLGIDGNVTYSKHLALVVPQISLDRLLLETDAPYLTPIPHRGKRNEPKYIPLVARAIADLKKISVREVADATTRNTHVLFAL